MKDEKRNFLCSDIQLRQKGRILYGIALPWNQLSEDLGGFRERWLKGSVAESLKRDDQRAFFGHDTKNVLGRSSVGTLKLWESRKGLEFEINLPSTTLGRDVTESVGRGDISGVSVGFSNVQETWTTENGDNIRTVEKARLNEISIVTYPAFSGTKVDVRSKQKAITSNYSGGHMNETQRNLREKRNKAWETMTALNNKCGSRSMGAEDTEVYNRAQLDFDDLTSQIESADRVEDMARREAAMDAGSSYRAVGSQDMDFSNDPESQRGSATRRDDAMTAIEQRQWKAFDAYCRYGGEGLNQEQRVSLQMAGGQGAGYLVAPEVFVNRVLQKLDDEIVIWRYAQHFDCEDGASLGIPHLATDVSDAEFTGEITSRPEDTAMKLEKRSLTPHALAKLLKVSKSLINRSTIDIAAFVVERLTYKASVALEKSMLTGDGSGECLGIFTLSNAGIPVSRDMSTHNSTTAVKADNLYEAKFTLKAGYLRRARWIMNRVVMKQVCKLKSGEGEYLFQPSLADSQPDRILGLPVHLSEFAPSTMTQGKYVYVLGDFGFYLVATGLKMRVDTLIERYADVNQNGYILRMEVDGMPGIAEAFVRGQLQP